MPLKEKISNIILSHIQNRYGNNVSYANKILEIVKLILPLKSGYNFPNIIRQNDLFPYKRDDNFQESLSKVNEKEDRRKKEGVYYTDNDVTDYLVANIVLHYIKKNEKKLFGIDKIKSKLLNLDVSDKIKILTATAIDPTCGTGEFLISLLQLKIIISKTVPNYRPECILETIFGNDIESTSTEITKIRLFFLLIDSFNKEVNLDKIARKLNQNFLNVDAVLYDGNSFGKKDIVIGNPPYVEYRNFEGKTNLEYGNVYADVLHYSVDSLTENGIMGFVIPLSYISTIRMSKIRSYIMGKMDKQIVASFADRPDCLFSGVHQKLNILIAQVQSDNKKVLTSSYNYWYQSERTKLFDNIKLVATRKDNNDYWPKVGNVIEKQLYSKFLNLKGMDFFDTDDSQEYKELYVNQRACFWMKVFTFDMKSNSYTKYSVPRGKYPFVYCLLNSSLFFLLWVIISDGWHLTKKELSFIKIPVKINDLQIWEDLMIRLEKKLEETKKYVGTKQVEYEYKHKNCKEIIDEIDKELAKIYNLTDTQLEYIKNFALKYRISDGAQS